MSDQFLHVPLAEITASLTNPRTSSGLDAASLAELAQDIKARGVDSPILLRPLPGARVADTDRKVKYEIVAGERRYRASELAGQPTIPARVRSLSDEQALLIQLAENLHRQDLSPLEEAQGIQRLMDEAHITAEEAGQRIEKSRRYIYNRLTLLKLGPEGREALRAGQIDASRALLIASVPDSKLQLKALNHATTVSGYGNEPPSVRALQDWLKTNVMLDLERAVFKITDARLVEGAGSCTDCPKRTGADPDLFSHIKSADMCTDPPCYHQKADAHRAQLVKKAEAKGLRIVEGKEAQELLGGSLWRDAPQGYTSLSAKRPDLSAEGERPTTLAQALGKDAPAPILFIHPKTQEAMELVPEQEAEAILLAKGLLKPEDATGQSRGETTLESLQANLEALREDAETATAREAHTQIYAAARAAVRATSTAQARQLLAGDLLRAWLLDELDTTYEVEDMAEAIGFEFQDGQDEQDALAQHIQRLGDAEVLRATALYMLGKDSYFRRDTQPAILNAAVQALGVDTKAAKRAAATAVKAQFAEQIKALQAQIDALNSPPADDPAARPTNSAKGKASKPEARAKKLSAQDAEQGIAAAMQGIEGAAAAPKGAVVPPTAPADPLLAKAVKVITKAQAASVRLLKDELGIGTTKALSVMASLEAAGHVSPAAERGARKVLVAA